MPKHTTATTIDLDFRPLSYWDHADPASAILQNIKGQVRREMVRDFIEGTAPAQLGAIEPELLESEVDDDTRDFLGRIHPSWMGGEYLPGYRRGEVEIARIALRSTTGDVISFRARRRGPDSLIRYRVVDEYQSEYATTRLTSRRSLSLRQLVRFIDEADCGGNGDEGLSSVEAHVMYGAEGDVSFATVESELYPQLRKYYRDRLDAWAEELAAERAAEDGDDDQEPEENE